ncbi:hypothetical protein C8F04DRAFT_1180950 [Mycena alexandri]|uniref:F-box domain-containing protein n=1 Tax=Mycena alexandri TaxID=1745969 RepID=A0AAD6T444_9AGAR|nr:hypothetical protein C8F04DRAFT_1180950 [Mycena alexandri]
MHSPGSASRPRMFPGDNQCGLAAITEPKAGPGGGCTAASTAVVQLSTINASPGFCFIKNAEFKQCVVLLQPASNQRVSKQDSEPKFTMPPIPQDLIKVIVSCLEDRESLEASSLVSSAFCEPSQRILLSSLTLADHHHPGPPTYVAASTLLEESPHIASYITRLCIELPGPTATPGALQALQQILGKLENVDSCIVAGETRLKWKNIDGTLILSLHNFISRVSLQQLHVLRIDKIPLAVFVKLLEAAPLLAFSCTTVSAKEADLSAVPAPQSRVPERLILEMGAHGICDLLARPELAGFTAGLKDLKVMPHYARIGSAGLAGSAASTLTHLRLDFTGLVMRTIAMPPLPALTSLDVSVLFGGNSESWFRQSLSPMLSSTASHALAVVTISFFPIVTQLYSVLNLHPGLTSMLDSLLMAHPGNPRITWRPSFFSERDSAVHFNRFVGMVQTRMPNMHGNGRCFVEEYKYQYGVGKGSPLPYAV